MSLNNVGQKKPAANIFSAVRFTLYCPPDGPKWQCLKSPDSLDKVHISAPLDQHKSCTNTDITNNSVSSLNSAFFFVYVTNPWGKLPRLKSLICQQTKGAHSHACLGRNISVLHGTCHKSPTRQKRHDWISLISKDDQLQHSQKLFYPESPNQTLEAKAPIVST